MNAWNAPIFCRLTTYHAMLLAAFRALLEPQFDVVGTVTDGRMPLEEFSRLHPDVVISMPGLNGIAAATRLTASGSTATVVFVTNLRDREFVQESLALGDVGFVVKDRLVADLLPAIRNVLAGQSFVSPFTAR